MKKILFIILLFTAGYHSYSQAPASVDLRGDSIRIFKKGGSAELVLRNSTKDTLGFLINTGHGITQFKRPYRVNDSTIQIGPITIITQSPSSPPGTNTVDTIFIVGGGGGTFTADNGLTKNIPTNVQLGGIFLHSTTLNTLTFPFIVTGVETSGNSTFEVDNTSSGNAMTVNATTGGALVAITTTGIPGQFVFSPASTNVSEKVFNVYRGTTGTAAAGLGEYINYQLKDASNNIQDAGRLQFEWTVATTGTRTSLFRLKGVNAGGAISDWMTVDANGVVSNGTGSGFQSLGGVNGVFVIGTNSGVVAESPVVPGQFENTSASTNTATLVLELGRQGVAFNGAIGNGVKVQLNGHTSAGANETMASLISKMTDVTPLAPKGQIDLNVSTGDGAAPVAAFSVVGLSAGVTIAIYPGAQNFANNAAAITGGLTTGMLYRNGDALQIVH